MSFDARQGLLQCVTKRMNTGEREEERELPTIQCGNAYEISKATELTSPSSGRA